MTQDSSLDDATTDLTPAGQAGDLLDQPSDAMAAQVRALVRRDQALVAAHQEIETQATQIDQLKGEVMNRFAEIIQLTKMLEQAHQAARLQGEKVKELDQVLVAARQQIKTQATQIMQLTKTLEQAHQVASLQAKKAKQRIASDNKDNARLKTQINSLREQLDASRLVNEALINSSSWRLLAPARTLVRMIKRRP